MYDRETSGSGAHGSHCLSRREKHPWEHPHAAQCSGGAKHGSLPHTPACTCRGVRHEAVHACAAELSAAEPRSAPVHLCHTGVYCRAVHACATERVPQAVRAGTAEPVLQSGTHVCAEPRVGLAVPCRGEPCAVWGCQGEWTDTGHSPQCACLCPCYQALYMCVCVTQGSLWL